ncbi:MAG: isoprenylcysteine carboxylmethyltransferase family protein [Acidobacteriia bacterium]|nr:isoprenylcysteine carboxylmethyltransferase family protein [Terriglobia bacterium]MYG02349.1 isoprenylcysteine carboxylmethyltransferase family protein [Terriglobia bacterium]MYK11394.1 isoprenylcysteine carboxylmethyltransferase family protein [Terriglobia bacterium]
MMAMPGRTQVPIWKRWPALAARSRVTVSILLAVAAGWLAQPTVASVVLGLPLVLAGLALRAWAAGHLRKNQQLAISGPYAHVRNPLYIGSLSAGVGFGICSAHPILLVAILVVFTAWFLPVVGEEEGHIRKILPGYREYESRVPRFVPACKPLYESSQRFEWGLYLVNREYSALLGFVGFGAVLWLKLQVLG